MEVLVATGLLCVVVVSLMVVLSGGLSMLNQADQMSVARSLASQEIEMIRAGDYSFVPDGTYFDGRQGTPPVNGYPPAPYPSQAQGQVYTLAVGAQLIATNLRSVRVDVFWGKGHTLHLETLMNPNNP